MKSNFASWAEYQAKTGRRLAQRFCVQVDVVLRKDIAMIKIMKKSELQGAAKYGNCASCGKGSDEAEIYKIECGDSSKDFSNLDLCLDCLAELGDLAFREHIKECGYAHLT